MTIQTSRAGDQTIARLADVQHGVVARSQLLAAGLTASEIGWRLRHDRLLRMHRGIYAVGHRRLAQEGFWLAAVLAGGPGAALSHRDAAALHGLERVPSPAARIEITTPRRQESDRRLRVHGRRPLVAAEVTTIRGIAVTSVARTLVDLAGVTSRERLSEALSIAEREGILDLAAVDAARERVRGRPGAGDANLRAVLAEHAARGTQLTREELERRLRRLVRIHHLGSPLLNAHVCGYEVDAFWPDARLVVETDGWRWHRDRRAFARDREKSNALQLAGYTVLRFTHDAVTRRPSQVSAAIGRALT